MMIRIQHMCCSKPLLDERYMHCVQAYERSHSVYNFEVNECGPVYFLVGMGGTGGWLGGQAGVVSCQCVATTFACD
jgi:hypothetical protein